MSDLAECRHANQYINEIVDLGLDLKDFTCHDCDNRKTCEWSWDLYNINGECLALK